MLVVLLDIFLSLSLEKTDDRYLNFFFFEIPIKKFIFTLDFFQIVWWSSMEWPRRKELNYTEKFRNKIWDFSQMASNLEIKTILTCPSKSISYLTCAFFNEILNTYIP